MKKTFKFLAWGTAYIVPFIYLLATGMGLVYATLWSLISLSIFIAIVYGVHNGILKLREGKKLTAISYLCSAGLIVAIILAFVFMPTIMEIKHKKWEKKLESQAYERRQAIEKVVKSDEFKKEHAERQEGLRKRYLQERGGK
ncbi:MAG: hypothetical protein ACOYU2_04390 [Nitrospirota bacterium]